jgi:PAS domain S-box-containing protein
MTSDLPPYFNETLALQSLLSSSRDLIYFLDADGRYQHVSRAGALALGLTPDQMVGRTWKEVGLPPEREKEFAVERAEVLGRGLTARRQVRFTLGGQERLFDFSVSPVLDRDGNAVSVMAVSRDITEQTLIEEMLRQEATFRLAIEQSLAAGVFTVDLSGRLTYVNPAFVRMVGWTAAELVGADPPFPYWPAEDLDEISEARRQMLEGTGPARRELRFQRKSGERFPVLIQITPFQSAKGDVGGWLGLVHDITTDKAVETALRASEQSYRDLADAMPQIVWTGRPDGSMDYLNKRWYDFAGLPPTARVEEGWEAILHPDDGPATLDRWNDTVTKGQPYSIEHRFFDRATGEYRWFLSRALPVRNDDGEIIRWFGTATDIDDQRRAVEELQRREERLVKTNAVIHTVGQVSQRLSAELNVEKLVQTVTDAATQLTGGQFGAFFYNLREDAVDSYTLYAVSGVPRAAFERFPMPRNPEMLGPTFRGGVTLRSEDIRKDPRYGHVDSFPGLGHLPVASYLAVPVVSRSGEVMGALVFGHAAVGIFTEESEQIAVGLASQAAIAIDNARLFESATRATAEIQRGEERYRTLVTATARIVWSASPTGEFVADSASWRAVTGQSQEEWLGRGWLAAVHPADQGRVWSGWTESVAGALPFELEYRLRTRDGSYRWFAARAYPVRDPDGTIREWIGAASDIDDERRSAEAAAFIAEAAALLSSSLAYEATLRSLANLVVPRLADCCAIDMVAEHDIYERVAVAHVDPAEEARFWDAERRRPSPSPLLDPVASVLASAEPLLLEDPAALANLGPDEERRRLVDQLGARSMLIVPMIARGRTLGSISLLFTSSDRRYSRSDLPFLRDLARSAAVAVDNARLYTEAQTANRAKDEFLATLSHELRTPMTAVLGWAQLLRIGGLDEPTFQEAIETIERSSQIQAQLIDDILDVSRINVGKLRLDVGPVDLAAVIEAALDTVRQAARGKSIALVADLDRSIHIVQGDPNRLQQVFWNLLSNAVKFTGRDGEIRVTLDRVEASARVKVSDNGRGITSEFLPHVFEQFRQADSSTTRIFGGLGLGLAIVRQIVELHGGSVSARSEGLDRGACFTVLLPFASSSTEESASATHSDAPAPNLQGLHVLLVEADETHQRLIASMLTRAGAQVRVESSSQNALDGLRHHVPDILVANIAMPDEDGLSLIGRIRNDLRIGEERMPAVAITSFGRLDDRLRILGAGFQNYLVKPVDPADLIEIVRTATGR